MKKRSKSKLKKDLWAIFTLYIKNRDNWTCVTCGRYGKGRGMGGGHYIAKGACGNEYYFHEQNVHAQCTDCNLRLEGNRPAYRQFILDRYGKEVLDELETKYSRPSPDYPFEEKIEYYKCLVKEQEKKASNSIESLLHDVYESV